ncbi:MAG: response regulator transcription factor [Angustibacter sp.]
MPTVLLADDDPTVVAVLVDYLRHENIAAVTANNGAEAQQILHSHNIDVAVLDIMMGSPSGLDICAALRQDARTQHIPIILLTALDEELDRIAGFEVGADDYVTKPFSPREMLLRIQALLRRTAAPRDGGLFALSSADLTLDPAARTLHRGETSVPMTAREYDLLYFLLRHPRQAFSRTDLLQRVWGWSFGDESTVTVHVRRIREKVEPFPSKPQRLVTVWGSGYRWDEDVR